MSVQKPEDSPFIQASSSASLFGKDKVLSKKQKTRIDVIKHFRGKHPTSMVDPRFCVMALTVPNAKSSWQKKLAYHASALNRYLNYVEVTLPQNNKGEIIRVALNINSLAKRLGLTTKEIRELNKTGGLEKAIEKSAEWIDASITTIDKYTENDPVVGQLTYKEGINRPFTPRTFMKILKVAHEHAKLLKKDPDQSSAITIKEGLKEHQFTVVPKSGAGAHIFSLEAQEVTPINESSYATTAKIQSISGEVFVIKYAKTDSSDSSQTQQNVEALQNDASLTAQDSRRLSPNTGLFPIRPLFDARILTFKVLEKGKDGNLQEKEITGFIGEEGPTSIDLAEAIKQNPAEDSRLQICLGLGDLLSDMGHIAHGAISPSSFLMHKEGFPALIDLGKANLTGGRLPQRYVPPIVRSKISFGEEQRPYVNKEEARMIEKMNGIFIALGKFQNPEALEFIGKFFEQLKRTEFPSKTDEQETVFEAGAAMYQMITGREPPEDLIFLHKQLEAANCDKNLANMIVDMLNPDSSKRATQASLEQGFGQIEPLLSVSKHPHEELNELLETISKADVFAMGTIMYETIVGEVPFQIFQDGYPSVENEGYTLEDYKAILKGNLIYDPHYCNEDLADLILSMIDQNPETRISKENFQKRWDELR